jgi:hypothetical protein
MEFKESNQFYQNQIPQYIIYKSTELVFGSRTNRDDDRHSKRQNRFDSKRDMTRSIRYAKEIVSLDDQYILFINITTTKLIY